MIEIDNLTHHFGESTVLNDVSFTALDGRVTGFLGPNGAGKSTTMRALMGLFAPESGRAVFDGKPLVSLRSPMTVVGAVLDPRSAHPGRTAYAHLESLALMNGLPRRRVGEVLELTGLGGVAKRRVGTFSLGMNQRLSIAAALLGNPRHLVLDEPVNGLDAEGVKWVRELCRYYASLGRAVLLSSHVMSEVALTADDLVIIGRGTILERTTVSRFVAQHSRHTSRIVTPQPELLHAIFSKSPQVSIEALPRQTYDPRDGHVFRIRGADMCRASRVFAQAGLVVYELVEERASLEEAYMELTHEQTQYSSVSLTVDIPSDAFSGLRADEPNRGRASNGSVAAPDEASDAVGAHASRQTSSSMTSNARAGGRPLSMPPAPPSSPSRERASVETGQGVEQ